jgi:oxygen-independent coproporphyrinogen III oxidase
MKRENLLPLSVYLHIPFCGVKCSYCAFNTYTSLDHLIVPFVEALCDEISLVGRGAGEKYRVHTIFLGGGTPSLLTPQQIGMILQAVGSSFAVNPDAEITMEANPADLTRAYCAQVGDVGINRMSIGMQSSSETELRLFDRRHDNDAVIRAVQSARQGGVRNLNLDLIYGVPHQTLETWRATLMQTLILQPDHVSLYALSLEEGTAMRAWVERGKLPSPDDDLAADMYDLATDMLNSAGYVQYEISNWALPGRECLHNLQYWYNLDYVGLGPGAHGFAAGVRYHVLRSPVRYVERMKDARDAALVYDFPRTPVTEEAHVVERDEQIAETLIMGMRLTQRGIDRAAFRQRFGSDLLDIHGESIARHAQSGLLVVEDASVRLTERGRMLSNIVLRDFV